MDPEDEDILEEKTRNNAFSNFNDDCFRANLWIGALFRRDIVRIKRFFEEDNLMEYYHFKNHSIKFVAPFEAVDFKEAMLICCTALRLEGVDIKYKLDEEQDYARLENNKDKKAK
jgi:hypothetical protein